MVDLGRYNWIGDDTLEDVEILLQEKMAEHEELLVWDIDGKLLPDGIRSVKELEEGHFCILHTPGHSPGSITLIYRPQAQQRAILFTGDMYAYTTQDGGHMSGFPRYGNNLVIQAKTLRMHL